MGRGIGEDKTKETQNKLREIGEGGTDKVNEEENRKG